MPQTIQYVYDAVGNRISETINGITTTYVVNDVNHTTSSTTSGVTTSFGYDAAGNRTSKTVGASTTNYSFNSLGQLTSVNGAGMVAAYEYDPLGNRVSQTINGARTNYQFDITGKIAAAYGASASLIAHYTYGFGLVSQVSGAGAASYYDFNNIGSTIGITTTGGAYASKYAYLPFGETLAIAETVSNPFTFVGQLGVTADGSGLLHMDLRNYDPAMGAFVSNDIIGLAGGDPNIRRYVGNNPTSLVDPTGLCSITFGPQLAADGIGAGVTVTLNSDGSLYFTTQFGIATPGETWFSVSRSDASAETLLLFSHALSPEDNEYVAGGATIDVIKFFKYLWGGGSASDAYSLSASYGRETAGTSLMVSATNKLSGPDPSRSFPCPSPDLPVPDDGPCTLDLSGYWSYLCANHVVTNQFTSPLNIPGRNCSPLDVMIALSAFGGDAPDFIRAGGSVVPPAIVASYNCNPQINNIIGQVGGALGGAGGNGGEGGGGGGNGGPTGGNSGGGGPSINTSPPVDDTLDDLGGLCQEPNPSPLGFVEIAYSNIGLLRGQAGNTGYTAAQAFQVLSTLATFHRTAAALEGILATGAINGASLGIAGELNLLQTVHDRLRAVTSAYDLLFGGNSNWLKTNQPATLQQWVTAFYEAVQASPDGSISPAVRAQLLAITLPAGVSIQDAEAFLDRWNRTVLYWSQGITMRHQVAVSDSVEFYDLCELHDAFAAAKTAQLLSQIAGYADVGAEAIAVLRQVQESLAGHGVCATVTLQIDQTATLTRSAFTGTLTLTNSAGDGSLTDVEMTIAITDAQGVPANGRFFVSSATFTGAFDVVAGHATLPDNSSGTMTFTFIPNNTAAPQAPALYRIGGTISFVNPGGMAISIPVFPATITVEPEARLQVNYFLQQTVIGDDPFTLQTEPSQPAVLGMLVTNVGYGAANNLAIATSQPEIIQNDKGLAVTIQIVGTQVGTEARTPSLNVTFGDIAPGQTADAAFLLQSSLQGTFNNFTATFTHSDQRGGLATSLIESVTTHTLIHAGNFNHPTSDGRIDYLAEETLNPAHLPDTIFFSNGATAAVNLATNMSSALIGSNVYAVTASVTSGWVYLRLPDPGAGLVLSQVQRSDGVIIPLADQAWTTDRTMSSTGRATLEYRLHILDFNSTGSYTATYSPAAQSPTITITAPLDGSASGVTEPTLSATVADRSGTGLASVQFQYRTVGAAGWTNAGPVQTSAPYLFVFGSPLAVGSYEFRVLATDNAANSTTSSPAMFTVLAAPSVTASTASLAANAQTLVITGAGFDTNPAHNSVAFNNGVTGTVTGVTPTSLTVSLSGLASLAAGTVVSASASVNGVSSGAAVSVATVAPVVTSSAVNLASNALSLTIAGFGFDTDPADNIVTFSSGVTGVVTAATRTSLTVSLTGLSALAASTPLFASVTVNNVGSGGAVQAASVAPAITWAIPGDITYGAALGAAQLNAVAAQPGTLAYSPAAGVVLGAGANQTLQVTFTPTDTVHFSPVTVQVLLNVHRATLTVTANDVTRAEGAGNPPLTATITGFVNNDDAGDVGGSPIMTTAATAASALGNYPIIAALGTLAAANYNFTFVNGTLTVADLTPPTSPGVALTNDTGVPGDSITRDPDLTLTAIEPDALVEYSTDDGLTWTTTFTAAQGSNTVKVRQTDVAGNVSTATSFSFTLDTAAPAAPDVSLTQDTGSSDTDMVTKNGALTLAAIEAGATVEYSIDDGANWTSTFTAAQGSNTVKVRQTDVAGNVSAVTTFTFTLDTAAPAAPGVSLTQDTGSSDTDMITRNGALTLTAIEAGATVEYSIDDGVNWASTFTAAQGSNTVKVRQIDVAGNVSAVTTFTFTLDTAAPAEPDISLTQDTGSSPTDTITKNGALTLAAIEAGATVEYSTDGGATWSDTFAAAQGGNTVGVRQTDVAGNVSAATTFAFTLDTAVPAAPGVSLTQDTGSSDADAITKNGALTLATIEAGATVEYSIDAGATWSSTFTAAQGGNTVRVRQTDVAGNVSAATTFTFTLDTAAPAAPGVLLTQDTGSSATDRITTNGALTLAAIEAGATVEYSIDAGATWSSTFTAAQGGNTVRVRQTDVAGNVSAATTFTFTLTTPSVAIAATGSIAEGGGAQTIAVTLTNAAGTLATAVTVEVVDAGGGSATGGIDYAAIGTRTITFPAGSPSGSTQTVTLTPASDLIVEINETVRLALQNAAGAVISSAIGVVTIVDDDFSSPILVDVLGDIDNGNYAAGDRSFREAVRLANDHAGADVIRFSPSLAGGTIVLTGGQLDVTGDVTIAGLTAKSLTLDGGGASRIFAITAGTSVAISRLSLQGGNASRGGALDSLGNVSIFDVTFTGNTSSGPGGAISVRGGTMQIVNATIVGNSAAQSGGGIDVSAGQLTVVNVTLASNRANTSSGGFQGGGIAVTAPGTLALYNTLVAGNTNAAAADDLSGTVDPASRNNLVGANAPLGGILETNPDGTAALADNGGAARTVILAENSPALGAASTSVPGFFDYDQRDAARDPLTPDIGAYEVQHPLAAVGTPSTYAETFQPRPSASQNEAFVKGLYQSTLLRDPDPAGLAGWVSLLNSGASKTDIAYGFVNSVENRSNQVTFFYKYFLGREPDAVGLQGWVSTLQAGADEGVVMSGFLLSPEFTGQNTNESFVNLMYYAVLGRAADPDGFANWTSLLNSGQLTRGQVGDGFLRSQESITRVVISDFQSYLKRTITADQASGFVTQIGLGKTFGRLAADLLGSEEFYVAAGLHL